MKKFKFLLSACMAALLATSFTACSDDPAEGNGGNNNPEETTKDYHFDLFLSVGKHGGNKPTFSSEIKFAILLFNICSVLFFNNSAT